MADDPRDLADRADSAEQARALRDRFLAEMASPSIPDERALELEDAINQLESDWPEIHSTGAATARSGRDGRRRKRAGQSSGSPGRRAGRRSRSGTSRASSAGGGGPFLSPRVRGYYRRTGIPGAIGSGADIALAAIGGTLGLILLYLFIANRRGTSALVNVITSTSKAFANFVRPVDPLTPAAARAAQHGGRAHAAPAAGPHGPHGPGRGQRRSVGSHVGGG